jgi:hypothetical protein
MPVVMRIIFPDKFSLAPMGQEIRKSQRVEEGSGSIRRASVESNRTENDIR